MQLKIRDVLLAEQVPPQEGPSRLSFDGSRPLLLGLAHLHEALLGARLMRQLAAEDVVLWPDHSTTLFVRGYLT